MLSKQETLKYQQYIDYYCRLFSGEISWVTESLKCVDFVEFLGSKKYITICGVSTIKLTANTIDNGQKTEEEELL